MLDAGRRAHQASARMRSQIKLGNVQLRKGGYSGGGDSQR